MEETISWLSEMEPKKRCLTISRVNFREISRKVEKLGGIAKLDKNSWLAGEIVAGFEFLKERMKNLRISKDDLDQNGIDFKLFRSYYFAAL